MEGTKGSPNKLAVFEHVPHTRSSSKRFNRISLSDSDSDEQTDVIKPAKRRCKGVRLAKEPLNLMCMWQHCPTVFENYDVFIKHIFGHISNFESENESGDSSTSFDCKWANCNFVADSMFLFTQHVIYHGYLMRLKNIGQNVLKRFDLPDCIQSPEMKFPQAPEGYICEWEDCNAIFNNVYHFFNHIKQHVNCFPKYCAKGKFSKCEWTGCTFKFPSQYKLSDHLRTHTKERVVACPTCESTFAAKTKFYDHRKRQLPVEDQNYQCSQCTKMFPSERLLKDHIRSHVNLYKCPMCDMTCPKPSALAAHVRFRHFSERPVGCTLCEHRCVNKNDLMQHLLVHCSKGLYECDECTFSCRSLHGLDKHYQQVHGHEWTQTYECHVCGLRFYRGNYLTKHLMKQHGFHWPSGHSRFRYKVDSDGIYRLQTVRYESLEVTEEIINSTTNLDKVVTDSNYVLKKDEDSDSKIPKFVAVKEKRNVGVLQATSNSVLITINDVDEGGNILNSEIIESNEVKLLKHKEENDDIDLIQETVTTDRVLRSRKK